MLTRSILSIGVACGLALQVPAQPAGSLAAEIQGIRAIDNHAHVMRPVDGDRDFDALPADALEPSPTPVHLRPDAPMFLKAWKALFKYPYDDATPAHRPEALTLKRRIMQQQGAAYPAWVLDQQRTDIALANRLSMGPELPAARFKWVPYADALIFPLDNSAAKASNRDYASYYPPEETLLKRFLSDAGLSAPPPTLDGYVRTVVTATLERHRAGGAVAEKFEIAYLRWLDFGPASAGEAAPIYARYVKGGVPSAADYKTLQDYLFAYTARECGRLGMAVHMHVADGGGGNYDQRGSNPLLLTWLFNEPSLRTTTFVVVHGGFPFTRNMLSLMSKPNVYADTSFMWFMTDVHGLRDALREWIVAFPEKVLFGSDATPIAEDIGWEEAGWVGSTMVREALAGALTELIDEGEITRSRASEIAHLVLHDNAARLYGLK